MRVHSIFRHIILTLLLLVLSGELFAQDKKDQELAMMFFRDGNYEKAASLYEKLYDEKPTQYFYTYLLFSYLEIAEFKGAEKLVKNHIRKNDNQPRYYVDLGYIYVREGEPEKAEKYFEQALDETAGSRGAIISLANAFRSRQQMDWALKTYERGRKLNPNYSFRSEMASIYERLGRFPEMLEEYLLMLEEDPNSLNQVQNKLQSALADDPEGNRNEAFRVSLLRKVQQNPNQIFYSELLIWHAIQKKDFDLALIQAQSIDRRLGEDGERVYELAQLAAANKDYPAAIDALEYVIRKGETEPYFMLATISHLNVRFEQVMQHFDFEQEKLEALEKEHEDLILKFGYNEASLPLIRNLAKLRAFYLDKPEKAIELLEKAKDIAGLNAAQKAQIKLELGDIYLFTGEVWEATLLYSQVDKAFKHDEVGHMAKLKNAKLSFYIGEFDWAKAQLDVLKAATSKLIANDAMDLSLIIADNQEDDTTQQALQIYANADLLLYRNQVDSALLLLKQLESAYTYHPILDEVMMKEAEIFTRLSDFEKADSLYNQVLTNYPDDIYADDALYQRGLLAEEVFKDKDKAMELYERLMFEYPGSLFVVDARKRFRTLRGDLIN